MVWASKISKREGTLLTVIFVAKVMKVKCLNAMHLERSVKTVTVPIMFLQNILLILDLSTHRDSISLVPLVLEVLVMGEISQKNQHNKHKQRPRAHAVDSVEADDQGTGSDSATDYSSSDYDACMILIERPHGSVEQSEIEVQNVRDVKCGRKYEKKVLATMELVGNP